MATRHAPTETAMVIQQRPTVVTMPRVHHVAHQSEGEPRHLEQPVLGRRVVVVPLAKPERVDVREVLHELHAAAARVEGAWGMSTHRHRETGRSTWNGGEGGKAGREG